MDLVQAALIGGGLLVQAWRRRQAEVALRRSQAELQLVGARLLGAEEGERSRIVRELHDDIGQRTAVLTMNLDGLATGDPWRRPPGAPPLRQCVRRRHGVSG